LQGGGHRFDPDTLHFFRRCANRGSVEVVAGQDLVLAVDLEFGDKLADEGFGFLRFAGGEELLKLLDLRLSLLGFLSRGSRVLPR
jgi:hypothetical protein